MTITFKEISNKETHDMILNYHYAKRIPSISFSFGAFEDDKLIGCVTYGKPASPNLCRGVCGSEYADKVYELNRLVVLSDIKNLPSQLIGYSLKQLKKHNLIIISFADMNMNHHGYVYQATNWIYTGLSAKRTDTYAQQGIHGRHISRDFSDETKHLRILRSRKHRYIYFACDKKSKKEYLKNLKYGVEPYPKGDNDRYEYNKKYNGRFVKNKITNEVFYEEDGDTDTILNNRITYIKVSSKNLYGKVNIYSPVLNTDKTITTRQANNEISAKILATLEAIKYIIESKPPIVLLNIDETTLNSIVKDNRTVKDYIFDSKTTENTYIKITKD